MKILIAALVLALAGCGGVREIVRCPELPPERDRPFLYWIEDDDVECLASETLHRLDWNDRALIEYSERLEADLRGLRKGCANVD